MIKPNFDFEIDGEEVSDSIIEKYLLKNNTRNLRFSYKTNSDVINFVGFEIEKGRTLVSFPKNYIDIDNKNELNQEDISLLFDVLMLDQNKNYQNYVGPIKDFESNFPFHSFFSIYRYFQCYGLYNESVTINKIGYNGKINWKETIRKSNTIISNNSIVYLPFFVKETQNNQVFLSECMAFAIDYTLKTFPYFINGEIPKHKFSNFDFLNNKEHTIKKLKSIYGSVFKDLNKKLIYDLINFFKELPLGGQIIIKHYNFELIWESIVENYLNKYFITSDKKGLIMSKEIRTEGPVFQKAKFFVDKIHETHRLEPDHYSKSGNEQYIFDSKYYSEVSSLNHKQLVYHTLLRSEKLKTTSALIIPTSKKHLVDRKHFELKTEYCSNIKDEIVIWEHYLNVKFGMKLLMM